MRSVDFCKIQAKSLLYRLSRLKFVFLLLAIIAADKALSQPCSGAPSFTINLTGNPDSVWTSPDTARAGDCCGSTNPDKCIEFNLTLDSLTAGIKLDIISGAVPGGALFYQIACGTSYQVGQDICLNGVGPHRITFCKPGNNHNVYQITAIPRPQVQGKLLINQACIGYLRATGLIDTSIHWQSVPNNATYNSYLSCLNGCDSVAIIPTGSFPPTVTYRVCGIIDGGCSTSSFCDTATVRFVTKIDVDIQPKNPTVCFGGSNTNITAYSLGGLKPFTFTWSNGITEIDDTSSTISVGAGTYYVRMVDSLGCTQVWDTVVVTAYTMPIEARAGNDTTLCTRRNYAQLAGSVQVATGGKWIGGTGTFVPNDTTLNAVYYPSVAETNAGVVNLKLVTRGNGTCPADTDDLQILILPSPVPLINGPSPICAYRTSAYTAIPVMGATYQWTVTGGTIQGISTNVVVGVTWGSSGTGIVTLTQTNSNGCDSTITKNVIITPTPPTAIVGPDTVCEYKQITYTTPTDPGNTYLWTVTGGTVIGSNTDSTLRVLWGANGSGSIMLKQTNTFNCDSIISVNILITPTPVPTITGPGTVCEYKQISYSTNTTPGNTYQWSVTGGTIVGSGTNPVVTIAWGANGSGTITVKQINSFGCDSAITRNITITPTPVPTITGPSPVCSYKQTSYSTNPTAGNTYLWSVTGGSIIGSNTGTSITVLWSASGSGTVTVKQTNTFTCDSTVTKNITINPTPAPTITGPTPVCEYKQTSYSTNTTAGNTYLWTVTGGTIVGSNSNSTVTIAWGANGSGTVTVKQTNTFTCDSAVTKNIVINPTPAPTITGPTPVCEYKQTSYSTNTTAGNTYLWTVTGGTIVGSNSNSTVTVAWGANGSGTVTIKQTNTFSCDSTVTKNITITPTPAPVITGPSPVCEYKQTSYSTNTTAGNTYQWSVTGGSIIGSSAGSSINVLWAANGSGTVTVKQTNTFNCDSTVTKNITITPTPAPVITGPGTVCSYKQISYSTNTTAGNTYQWSVTGGAIVGSSTNSTVTVAWDTSGSGTITIKQTNTFTCDSTVTRNITITPTPFPTITGPTPVCAYKQTSYSTNTTAGNTYLWTVTGGTIVGSNTNSTVTIAWSASGSGTVTVKQTNTFTCDSTVTKNITINPTPFPTITGPTPVCAYKQTSYSTNTTAGNTYQWTVTGGSIIGSSTGSSINVLWAASGSGTVTVKQTNSFTCDSTVTKNITINPTPAPVITGPTPVCSYKQTSYSTNTTAGNTYLWTVTGGTIVGSSTSSTVTVAWGASGSGTVTVKQTNTFTCDSAVTKNITITPTPAPTITGPTPVCAYKQTSYSTNTTAGNTYLWTVTGGTIVGSNANSTVTVAWSASGSGTVTVKQTNTFNCDSTVTKNITINPTPFPTITGPTPVCAYKQTSYSTNTTAGNTYLWTVTGGTIVGSSTSSSVTVAWGASGSGTVTVKQTNTFTCDSTVTKNITITPTPFPTITGPTPVCAYKQTSYSTNTTAGNTYLWTVTGGTIVGSNSNSTVTVAWGTNGSGTVTVKQTNSFTCDSTVTKNITITPTPAPTITGPTPVCAYKQTSYSTNTTAGNTYQWTVTGGSIVGSSTGTSINVLWAASGSGTVTIKQTNTFTCDSTVTKNITINPTPAPTITGPSPVCSYKQTSYTTNTTAGNTYLWTVTGGTIVGSNSNSTVTVAWGINGSGTVTVKQTNTFTCDSAVTKNITITPTPAPVITGPTPVCEYKQTSYSTNTTAGNTYLWTVTGGTIVGSNSNSTVTVAWGINGSGTVTVKQTNTFSCDSTVTKNITITPTPAPTITGPGTVCAYKQTSYSTNTTAGNTYLWTVTGGTIVGSSTNSSVTIAWAASGSGTVTVKQTNTFNCDSTVTKNITITPTPFPTITGPSPVCAYKQTSYSTNTTAGNTYLWTVTGGTIVGSNSNSTVTVAWGINGSGTVTVKQTNTFTCDSTVTKNITITPTPAPTITGPTPVCAYKQTSYSTNTTAGNTYQWTVTGGSIVGSSTGSSINVLWAASGSGTVTIKQTNTFNCDSTVTKNITINPTPAPTITGPGTVCSYKQTSYSTNTTAGNTYLWTVTGGTIVGSNTNSTVAVAWGINGSGTVTVKQTNTFTCDSAVTKNITITPTPAPLVAGPTTVCEYKPVSYYSTNTSPGMTYQWSVTGGNIIGSSTDSIIDVIWAGTGTGTVTIKQVNLFNCDSTINFNVTITPTPAPVITGPDTVCEYKRTSYSTNTTAGNAYLWTVTGGSIIGSSTGSSITVLWSTNGNGTVKIKQTNVFNCDSTIVKNITINPTPVPVITGPGTVCSYKQTSYSTNTTAGNSYLWTITGGTIVGSSTNSTVTVAWGINGSGTVTVKQTNTFTCDSVVTKNITITPTPAPVITGPDTVCEYKPATYSTNTTVGNTYQWTVTGGSIVGSSTGSSINVLWSTNGSGTVTVKQTNTFNCDSTVTKNITITPTPAPVITGPGTVCEYKQVSYSTNTTASNVYQWSVTGGTIVGSSSNSTVTVAWAANGGGTVTVKQTNTFNCDSTITKNITISPTPVPVITGPGTVCEYKQTSYSTNTTAGNSYLWTVTGGTIVGSNTNSTVTIAWAANGSGTVTVKQTNTFTCDSTVTKNIIITPTPAPVITGPDTTCEYKQTSYSTNTTAGNTYLWTVTGGTIVGSNTNSTVTIAWAASGSGTVTVKQTNTFTCDSTVTKNIIINPTPAPVITGPGTVCSYKQTSYSTNTTAGNTYLWTVTGGTVVGSNTNSTVTIAWGANGGGTLTVKQTNSYQCDSSITKNITITPTPAPVINGPDSVCEHKQYSYSTNTTAGNTYQWTVTGGTIIGSNTNSGITVLWGTNGTGTVTIKQTNTFNCDSTVTLNIIITPTPAPVINGAGSVCEYKLNTYTTNTTAGNIYQWTVTGGTIVGSNVDSVVQVRWGIHGNGNLVLKQVNSYGCDSTVSMPLIITPSPTPTIAGPVSVCEYKPVSYYSTDVVPGNTYQWNVTGGYIIGSGTDTIVDIIWAGTGTGNVTITQTNSFHCDSTVSLDINITPTPAPVINGSDTVCAYKQTSYTTNTTFGNTYLWTVSGGTIIGSNTDTTIRVAWSNAANGNITLKQTNLYGCDSIISLNILITPSPVPTITGSGTVCEYKQYSYSTNTTAGNTYRWSVTGGTIVDDSTNSAITVIWDSAGSGSIVVKQINSYGCDSSITKSIIKTPTPAPIINGPDSVCEYKQIVYRTNTTPGNTYQWVVTGGTIVGSSTDTTVRVFWNANGSGSIKLTQINSFNCDSVVTKNIFIIPTPAPLINGPGTVCEYKQAIYATNPTAGNTYHWVVTGGTILIKSSMDTAITVAWRANGSGNITLTQTNSTGCDSVISRNITITPTPTPVIVRPDTVCEYKQTNYSTNSKAGNAYHWNVTGGNIVGSSTDTTLRVAWGARGTGVITMKQTNLFLCDSIVQINIVITPTPKPVINGPDTGCEYQRAHYTTNTTPGNAYSWSVSGGTIVGSGTDSIAEVLWGGTGNKSITLTQINSFHCDSTVTKPVRIQPTPVPVINGPDSICSYKTSSFNTPTIAAKYKWTVTGGTITGSNTGTSINVVWGHPDSGKVSLTLTNNLGCDSTLTRLIKIMTSPTPTINGDTSVCEFERYTYKYTTPYWSVNNYQWTVTGGTIIGSSTDTVLQVVYGARGSASVQLHVINSSGCDSTVNVNIYIRPRPRPSISGPDTICEKKLYSYSTANVTSDIYHWSVTGAAKIDTSTSNVLRVVWDTTGNKVITLTQRNPYGCDSTVTFNVFAKPTPVPSLSGPGIVCEYKTALYKARKVSNDIYSWNISGGTILSAVDTQAFVQWGNGDSGIIYVTETNSQGCDSTIMMVIDLKPTPIPEIYGPDPACEYKSYIYSAPNYSGHTYQWNVTGGTLQQLNDTLISVKWGPTGTGTISLRIISPFLCDSAIVRNIDIKPTPVPNFTGSLNLCAYTASSYAASSATPGHRYEWSITNGAIIGANVNPIVNVVWGSPTSGTLTLKQTSADGCDSSITKTILLRSKPIPLINGPAITCAGSSVYTYSATPAFGYYKYDWAVTDGNIEFGAGTPQVGINWKTKGNQVITLHVTDSITFCDSTVTMNIFVDSVLKPELSANSLAGCLPLSVQFVGNQLTPGYNYLWSFGDGALSTQPNPKYVYTKPGVFNVKVIVENSNGCKDSSMATVIVNYIPKANFDYSYQNERIYANEDTVFFDNTSAGGNMYVWRISKGHGDYTDTTYDDKTQYGEPGFYDVVLTTIDTATGCKDSILKQLEVRVRQEMYVPNAFTPNGDGVNDYFHVSVTHIVEFEMLIFDRWGEILFRTNDTNFRWDGTYQGKPAQPDVYAYLISGKGYHGKFFSQKGTITLLR